MMNISDLLNSFDDDRIIKRWKELAAKEIKRFSKATNPFKQLKVSNYYLYIDTKSRSFAMELQGVKPNAGHARGFGAPVDKYHTGAPRHIHIDGGWRTTSKERTSAPTLGTKALDTRYYGVSGKPSAFFGLKRRGSVEAFGLIDGTAVPIYSEDGFVEYITQENADEFERILYDAGFTALHGG